MDEDYIDYQDKEELERIYNLIVRKEKDEAIERMHAFLRDKLGKIL